MIFFYLFGISFVFGRDYENWSYNSCNRGWLKYFIEHTEEAIPPEAIPKAIQLCRQNENVNINIRL